MKVKLNNVRLSFAQALFEAEDYQGDGNFKFSSTFLIDKNRKDLIQEIEAAIKQVATAKWGAKADAIIKSIRGNNNKFCFRDGDEHPDYDGYDGHMSIKASNKARPLVIDRDRTPLAAADGKPYSGCYVNATITLFAYDSKGNKGISASLGGVQFLRDGDAFASGGSATPDDFDDVSEGADAESLI
ncbi:hypothetical protein BL250_07660 [Erwinia sp. OLTSP20]|uniref:DUF2815 family protein n=1 Tax=unclassified Erwinia TaxID=2622719 RepID=UPI000C1A59C2|nr:MULTISPECIES: DUF2815 family protein [unclassified Erwinia]EJC5210359.1 DUF2815 family protein [Salmonella enterica]PIJ50654.1 hypothetical protein BV501_07815 [Erwinia sp. OAMSP11]PIJ72700.1 hypothetical protein BK416_08685 [Erwinia sp. OLSSP12]PIJ83218.1 hypothetical protein BLD47_05075 [Erwinia sp. OLCASP19]PIJ85281.1 hypothetical protein BLD46_06655 [Erwinia sp. OLMTSP26]